MTSLNKDKILNYTLIFGGVILFSLMLVYSYQGWFTRYMADDYCNAVMFSDNAVGGLVQRYVSGFGGNRYSNIWLVGISELLGGVKSIPFLPVVHIMLWIIGLTWTMTEIKKSLKLDWSFAMTFFAALSIIFFTFIQAPNLYQSIYWRSSMSTHFAPVVFGTLLIAYLLNHANRAKTEIFPARSYVIVFVSAFIIGGFSEPADAIQITLLTLSLAAVWYWGESPTRERMLKLLAWTLGAALLSLLVMAVSPANSRRLGDDPHTVWQVLSDSMRYGYLFISKTIKELPLPTFLSAFMSALLLGLSFKVELSKTQKRNLWLTMPAILLLAYLLIVASFSPSALGQGYPVLRMQFYARLIMTLGLMIDGALLGILFSRKLSQPVVQWGMLALFFAIAVIYPARAAAREYAKLPEYSLRAAEWDGRHALILQMKAEGQTKLTVPQFNGVYGTKELDTFATHWANKCAAKYYGVKSIRAIPMP
jgi:hypothetical protein